ncbi:protein C19orf12-like [Myotis yumanensis]|uniref:protein C19orf12-like n=1 Tax=Myotis yumanensis TaxID=159337 RepID=UPI0038D454C1
MPLRVEDAMSLLCSLSGARKMKVAIKRRKRRVGLASTTALLGGLAGGPLGLAVVCAGEAPTVDHMHLPLVSPPLPSGDQFQPMREVWATSHGPLEVG